jgi:hypothetical protein
MQHINYCPECGKRLGEKKQHCTCGWRRQLSSARACADHRCQYESDGHRCPLPGTMCPYPYSSTPWYCSGHWSAIGDPRLGNAVLLDAEQNYEKILESSRHWHDKLFEKGDK